MLEIEKFSFHPSHLLSPIHSPKVEEGLSQTGFACLSDLAVFFKGLCCPSFVFALETVLKFPGRNSAVTPSTFENVSLLPKHVGLVITYGVLSVVQ